MKFNKGDTIICVNNKEEWSNEAKLKIGGRYTIKEIRGSLIFLNESLIGYPYSTTRFISIGEFRRTKILKIKNHNA